MSSTAPADSELIEAPSGLDSARAPMRRRRLPDAIGIAVVCLVVLTGYFQVPLGGKTFSTSSYVAGIAGCGSRTGDCNPIHANDPRPDGGASAWFFEPYAQVTHRLVANGEVPLWNPYQGIGSPFIADSQPGVFDPLMLGVLVHPTELVFDLSTILWLLLIGVAAYVAARALRMRPLAATVAGSLYGLSGWFFAYSNVWVFRAFMFLPLILAAIEWTVRTKRRLPVALLGVLLAWLVLVGSPEPTFLTVVAACLFAGARVLIGDREGTRGGAALRLLGGGALGIALAGPLLLPFREYLALSYSAHTFTGQAPATDSVQQLLNWMAPRITLTPRHPTFDNREWVGAGAFVLVILAMCDRRAMRRHAGWPLVLVTAVIGVQIYGGWLVAWTGHIPQWSQVSWTRLGTPVLALTLALLAGIGLQSVIEGAIDRRRVRVGLGVFLAVVIALIVGYHTRLLLVHEVSLRGGWPLALLAAVAVALAALFLRSRTAAMTIAVVVILEVVLIAPHGFYANRSNPHRSEPWITFVQTNTRDHSRVYSPDGILYPNNSSVYGLSDPRTRDALFPDRYLRFVHTFISADPFNFLVRYYKSSPLENIASNRMFDLLAIKYLFYYDFPQYGPALWARAQFQQVYAAANVKIFENVKAAPRAFVVHDIRAVKDVNAVVNFFEDSEKARWPDGTVHIETFEPQSSAVIEAGPGAVKSQPCADASRSDARIISSSSSSVKIAVTNNSCPGLLVLADQYFPGWTASVNGHHATIYPTDITLRGVAVPAGSSTVELRYRPASFRNGLVLFAIGIIALLCLAAGGLRSRRARRELPVRAVADDD